MTQWIGLSKSAHMLGIGRRDLQALIRNGDLHTFEGCVDLDELRQRFPSLVMDERSFIERISLLQDTAFSRRVRETVMASADLDSSLRRRTVDLAVERARAEKYCEILRELAKFIATMQCDADRETKKALAAVNRWLLRQLECDKSFM